MASCSRCSRFFLVNFPSSWMRSCAKNPLGWFARWKIYSWMVSQSRCRYVGSRHSAPDSPFGKTPWDHLWNLASQGFQMVADSGVRRSCCHKLGLQDDCTHQLQHKSWLMPSRPLLECLLNHCAPLPQMALFYYLSVIRKTSVSCLQAMGCTEVFN